MADILTLKLSHRKVTGKKVRRLRLGGIVPVHLYGGAGDSSSLQIEAAELRRILPRVGGNIPLTVEIDGAKGESICFVREVQRHPVTEEVLHVDFLRVEATQTVTADVPIILDGEAPAARNLGGTLAQPLQALTVQAFPLDMPAELHVDISSLDSFEAAVRVSDLVLSEGVTTAVNPNEMIARVMPPRLEEDFGVAVGEEEEIEEGETVTGEGGEEAEAPVQGDRE
jgi:large subunit ribosomal protein L25